jgi:hypothetical protein
MPSVYDRALFGSAPPPPNSVGVGITSGLAPPPGAGQMPPPGAGQMPPPGAGAPGGQVQDVQGMAVTAGLQDAAQQLQNMYGELDQAEDIESVINTLRGDQKPMKARYDELAGMVGEEDAGQTPESVLAILQPMFEILETVQKNVPEGGIASAPMNTGGEEPVNFNEASSIQAPGSEEAMARIAMGEQPMGFNLGGISDSGLTREDFTGPPPLPEVNSYPEVNFYKALAPENPYEIQLPYQSTDLRRRTDFPGYESGASSMSREFDLAQDRVKRFEDFRNYAISQGVDPNDPNSGLYPVGSSPETADEQAELQELLNVDAAGNPLPQALDEDSSWMSLVSTSPNMFLPGDSRLPELKTPDLENVRQKMEDYQELYSSLNFDTGETDPNVVQERREKFLADQLIDPRSPQQVYDEAQAFFGDDTGKQAELQAYLALAKAGSAVGGSTGSLLEGLMEATPGFVEDISRVAATRFAAERAAKESAYTLSAAEKKERQGQDLQLAMGALTEVDANIRDGREYKNKALENLAKLGMDAEIAGTAEINDQIYKNWSASNTFAAQTPLHYALKNEDDSFSDPKTGHRTADGIYTYVNGQLQKMPNDYEYITPAMFTSLIQTSGGLIDDAQQTSFVIEDPDSDTGFRQVEGFFSPTVGFFTSRDGSFRSSQVERLPDGFITGKLNDVIKIVDTSNGITRYTIQNPNGDVSAPKVISVYDQETGTRTTYPRAFEIDAESPYAVQQDWSGVDITTMDPADLAELNVKNRTHIAALRAGHELVGGIFHIAGVGANIASFATNNLRSLFPGDALNGVLEHSKTEQFQEQLKMFTRQLKASMALSSRYAMGEQQINALMAPSAWVFDDPEAVVTKLQEYIRMTTNELSDGRAVFNRGQGAVTIDRIPAGSRRDPFVLYDSSLGEEKAFRGLDYIQQLAERGVDLEDSFMRMTGEEAMDMKLPEGLYRDRNGDIMDSIMVPIGTHLSAFQ